MSTKKARTQVREDLVDLLLDCLGDEVWSYNPKEDDEESSTGSPTPPVTSSICDLPREVMLEVFSYFSAKELCCRLSLVCQEWYSLARDPILWQRLYLDPCNSKCLNSPHCRYALYKLLSRVPLLKSLNLDWLSDTSEILWVVGWNCPRLQKLEIKFCKNLKEEDLKGVIGGCPSISHLSLEGSYLPLTRPSSYRVIARLNNLKVLNLSYCSTLNSESLRFLADNLPSLQEFIIGYNSGLFVGYYNDLTDEDLIYFIDKKRMTLTKLLIYGKHKSDAICRVSAKCPELVSFRIWIAEEMTDVGVNEIAKLDKLIWLTIRNAKRVSTKSFVCLFQKPSAHKLMDVDVSDCRGVDDEVLTTIAENCPFLLFLAIRGCGEVSDAGIGYLVMNCTKLEYLDLSRVVKTTNRAIETIPEHLKNLKCLNLFLCDKVTENVIKKVVSRLPNLVAEDCNGETIVKGDLT